LGASSVGNQRWQAGGWLLISEKEQVMSNEPPDGESGSKSNEDSFDEKRVSRGPTFVVNLVCALFLIAFLSLFFMPGVRSGPVARSAVCLGNMRIIAMALNNYHDRFGSFPPAYIADENGRPMHSWRVLILPELDQQLYEQYDFSEPWDGPNNRKLWKHMPSVFHCPSDDRHGSDSQTTNYVAVVGENTPWPGRRGVRLEDISDGLSNTILLVETVNTDIHWMEPRDLNIEQMAPSINAYKGRGISSRHPASVNIVMCGGSDRRLNHDLPTETLRRLLEINDGKPVENF